MFFEIKSNIPDRDSVKHLPLSIHVQVLQQQVQELYIWKYNNIIDDNILNKMVRKIYLRKLGSASATAVGGNVLTGWFSIITHTTICNEQMYKINETLSMKLYFFCIQFTNFIPKLEPFPLLPAPKFQISIFEKRFQDCTNLD